MLNYLPFARRETVSVLAKVGARVLVGGSSSTNLAEFGTGGVRRAILQDLIIFEGDDDTASDTAFATDGGLLGARIGIDGKQFLTEALYDYRVMADLMRPNMSCWDWSCGGRYPYRLYPGQKMGVLLGASPQTSVQVDSVSVRAVFFSGRHVKNNEPHHLYHYQDVRRYDAGSGNDLIAMDSPRMKCPMDSPLDLYSVALPEWMRTSNDTQIIYIEDGNSRPFWPDRHWGHILDPPCSPISFGMKNGWAIDPDETIVVELQNGNPTVTTAQDVTVILRGVLEVEDGR